MTEVNIDNMGRGTNKHATSLKSQTTESKVYSSRKTKIDGVWVSLKLRDTVGFGAKDMETKNILKETFLEVVSDFDKIRGCILVHKCERLREGGYKDLEGIKQMFETMGLKFDRHLLLVITHTGHLSEETQKKYSDELQEAVILCSSLSFSLLSLSISLPLLSICLAVFSSSLLSLFSLSLLSLSLSSLSSLYSPSLLSLFSLSSLSLLSFALVASACVSLCAPASPACTCTCQCE